MKIMRALLYWPYLWYIYREYCAQVKVRAQILQMTTMKRTKKLRWAGNYLTEKYVEENALSFLQFVRKVRHG